MLLLLQRTKESGGQKDRGQRKREKSQGDRSRKGDRGVGLGRGTGGGGGHGVREKGECTKKKSMLTQ